MILEELRYGQSSMSTKVKIQHGAVLGVHFYGIPTENGCAISTLILCANFVEA